jgi:hypothetical protein
MVTMSGTEIAIGEPCVEFLKNYEFTGRDQKCPISEDTLDSLVDAWVEGLKKDERQIRRDFVRLYGQAILRKLFLFVVDTLGFSGFDSFTEDGFEEIVKHVDLIMRLFATHWRMNSTNGQIIMRIREDGRLAFYGRRGANMG